MAPRRSHRKSRAGCRRCKQRRIKCDEVHPECGNCVKHAVPCDFSQRADTEEPTTPGGAATATPGSAAATPTAAGSARTASLTASPQLGPTPLLPPAHFPAEPPLPSPPAYPSPQPPAAPAIPDLNLTDLTLMHHFTLSTSLTISNRLDNQILWRRSIPLLACRHPYLMRLLLAISALHLHSTTPSTHPHLNLPQLAAHHHALALADLTQTLPHITHDNADPLLAAAVLIVVYTFVSSRLDADARGIASWVPLLRGVHSILQRTWGWIASGPLSSLIFQYQLTPPSAPLDPEIDAELNKLYRLCTDRGLPAAAELEDTAVATAYFAAVAELRRAFASVSSWEEVVGGVFVWPITASDVYVRLLEERRERALIIFVHYVALFSLVDEFWWSRGSARWEMERVEACLGEEWRSWVEWPRRRIVEGDVGWKIGMRRREGERGEGEGGEVGGRAEGETEESEEARKLRELGGLVGVPKE